MANEAPPPTYIDWQIAVIESLGIDANQVSMATIVISADRDPRVIIEYLPDDISQPKFTKQYRLTEVDA